ncbi:MAG: hypothetical protein L0214_09040 [candidate division NC10 bacterium]|nr:hypothetical protein [candidate division NC10 bacterium]
MGPAAEDALKQAILLANAAAALAYRRTVAREALPDRAHVEAFLRSLRRGG